jgi:glycosyltransferase involved in cell wall biosynthesis
MKNIAFIHDIFPSGGAERITIDIAKYISENNPEYKFYVFTPRVVESMYTDDVKACITIKKISLNHNERNREVEQLVMSEGINLIIQVVKPLKNIKKIIARTGCKTILANHGEPFWERYTIIRHRMNSRLYKPLWKLFWRRYYIDKEHARKITIKRVKKFYDACHSYTVLCEEYKNEICAAFNINQEHSKIVAIENSERIVPDVTYDKEKIIMFCGRLENTSKRLDRLLRIWGKIQHKLPDYRLLIVGDGKYRTDMERQIAIEKLERVDMVGRHTNVEQFYRKVSIICLTSQTEGWPLCLTEGQAHGCIPVAFGCSSGVKDILSPSGVNGFIVTPFDEDEYAETLLRIAAMSDEERYAIRRSAVAKRANYTPDIIMKKWATLIESMFTE